MEAYNTYISSFKIKIKTPRRTGNLSPKENRGKLTLNLPFREKIIRNSEINSHEEKQISSKLKETII